MSKQDVPCSTVRFKKSSGLLYQVRPEETQRPREAGCRVPWQLTVIAIGILLSLRLVAVAMLVTNSGCVEMHWLCYGIKCYYFIMDKRTWRKCIQTCQNYSLSFLKIHVRISSFRTTLFETVTGLDCHIIIKKKEWSWIDNTPLNCDLVAMISLQKTGNCKYFSMTGLNDDDCGKRHLCICEKGIEKYPAPLCSVNERSQSAL
ncbi:ly49 stimulatory receptor 6 isoform X1 [Rattus norvegicus]|uniref:Ly49 stimulatory receptor 6 n=1 Tax=Rattus norvegicus TaxID=10116 RepID=A0A0G2K9W0_RAT|nr:Ly49 stimulatory receptor 6 [Rattus norvegicus]XP_017448234.1 ly49 stimulatory receptor 6 isoform X1 [Rattus norvegicus]|eukprot:XP_017448233.1 PREDICTED: ly49 stimulatory receptor 6 isoform X1 [Rattus norvegicus]